MRCGAHAGVVIDFGQLHGGGFATAAIATIRDEVKESTKYTNKYITLYSTEHGPILFTILLFNQFRFKDFNLIVNIKNHVYV